MIEDLFRISGRVALVTGGSKGIGKAIARGLAEAGADVVISARQEHDLAIAAAEIQNGLTVRVRHRAADMTDRKQIRALAAWTLQELGRIDILVNNAGSNQPQTLLETTDETWDRIVELNLTSCMQMSRAAAPSMIDHHWGRIINISSIMGLASSAARGSYSATKAALIGMTRAHALELGPHGITVNCLAPGPVATDLPMRLLSAEQKATFAERTALKRWGETVDMVGPALLLASQAGAFITGSVLVADGGFLCRTF
jgi:NAD(P)-dependent dehydrogenase (short-subunit alcohol dehydrogenase family)